MLAFLQEQGHEDSWAIKPAGATGETVAEVSGQMQEQQGLEDSSEEQQEYLTVADQSKNVRKGTIVLVVLFAAGLLCLWLMIKKTTLQTATAAVTTEQAMLEAALVQLTGIESEMAGGTKEIVNKFYEFSNVEQVTINELAKNPFRVQRYLGHYDSQEDFDADISGEDLELYSIMQSDQGYCCMINGKILYEGDSISGFKVCQIGDNFVKLEQRRIDGGPQGEENFRGPQMLLKLSE